jgi:hypothetical protein
MIYAPIVVKKESVDRVRIKRSVELEKYHFFLLVIPGLEIDIDEAIEYNKESSLGWIYSSFFLTKGFENLPPEFTCYIVGESEEDKGRQI